ncbi:MAG: cytochrome C oxidase subunit IV family protein [Planctomycetes bacterium]|nr:cytochrome C oxidase subunit IV family protein [Planctomycetota bacterium]
MTEHAHETKLESGAQAAAHGHEEHHHATPLWLLSAVIVALLILTVITVGVAMATPNVFLAMFIATIKASLVCLFFMHLYWDKPFNSIVLLISIGLLGLFLWFAMLDTGQYQHTVLPEFSVEGMQRLRALEGH